MKRQQLFSRSVDTLLYVLAIGTIVFPQKSPDCKKLIINYDLDITNILVVSPQIRYIEVFDITNPPFNEQIWPVPSDFLKSRFHCIFLFDLSALAMRVN